MLFLLDIYIMIAITCSNQNCHAELDTSQKEYPALLSLEV